MSIVLLEILNMSVIASIVACAVILMRLLLKKAPRVFSYALWAIVLFKLLCPFKLESALSVLPSSANTVPQRMIYTQVPAISANTVHVADNAGNMPPAVVPPVAPVVNADPVDVVLNIASWVWFTGVMILLGYAIFSYIRLKLRLRASVLVRENIWETDMISMPFVLGFIKPRIYLPVSLDASDYIIAHEQTHIRRFDYLVKPIAFFALCLHWFNPIIWLSYFLFCKDMEMSCDESVLKRSGDDIRARYSDSLLALSKKQSGLISPLAFGESNTKSRIKNAMRYKKPSFRTSAAAIAAVIAVTVGFTATRTQEALPQTDTEQRSDRHEERMHFNRITSGSERDYTAARMGDGPESEVYKSFEPVPAQEAMTNYDHVKITLLTDLLFSGTAKFETDNTRIVADIENELTGGMIHTDQSVDLEKNSIKKYQIELYHAVGGYSAALYYDTLYDAAYVVKDGGLYTISTDFARYVNSFFENTGMSANVEEDAAELFKKYGWTLDYEINAMNSKLNDINNLSAFNPNTYYFAYNNELSKDIGLDMSGYGGQVDIEIYSIRESMPEVFYPIQYCRGIVVRKGTKIIGAYISAGRHRTFNACSLKGHRFETVTGKSVQEWLAGTVKADVQDERLSTLAPEQVLAEYFAASDTGDYKTAEYCLAKSLMLDHLTANMPNSELFVEPVALPLTDSNLGAESAKLLNVEMIEDATQNRKTYRVYIDLQLKQELTIRSGEQFWDCVMIYESPQTGWKINGFGH